MASQTVKRTAKPLRSDSHSGSHFLKAFLEFGSHFLMAAWRQRHATRLALRWQRLAHCQIKNALFQKSSFVNQIILPADQQIK